MDFTIRYTQPQGRMYCCFDNTCQLTSLPLSLDHYKFFEVNCFWQTRHFMKIKVAFSSWILAVQAGIRWLLYQYHNYFLKWSWVCLNLEHMVLQLWDPTGMWIIFMTSKDSPNMSWTDDNDDDVSHSVQSSDIYLRSGMRYLICVSKGISMCNHCCFLCLDEDSVA